ncbi:MAG: histidinol dehydrogenase [Phycisphaerae bacterium]|nr:histidinol dehydrogenase [Phycisphaerae bacterium]
MVMAILSDGFMGSELRKIMIIEGQDAFDEKIAALKEKISIDGVIRNSADKINAVRDIVREVAARGDAAVAEFTAKFDKVTLKSEQFRIPVEQLRAAHDQLNRGLLGSLQKAIENVKRYQSRVFVGRNEITDPSAGIRYTLIERVGICVPGAAAPLPSTVIMTAVPAIVAGVKEIAVISGPRYNGSIHPVILAVCYELGISEVYRIGGAQAVAALAWGTQTIKKVQKIVGPGNLWGQLAKREVFGLVDIDSIAGPSEVLILANDKANPAFAAADMLSQAEHAADSSAILITDSQRIADDVIKELEKQLSVLSRSEDAAKSLQQYGAIIVVSDFNKAILLANDFAAEHLQIQCGAESNEVAAKIKNAGAIFVGDFSPVAVGDYWAGPSHTLPTGRSAKFFSALSSNDFVKSTSIICYDKDKLQTAAADIVKLAETEGLTAHANSVKVRTEN